MKLIPNMQKQFLASLVGLALGGAALVASAQTPISYVVNTYDTSDSINGDWNWWGVCTPTWDGTQDVNSSSSSGSAYFFAPFGASTSGSDNQQQIMVAEDFAHTSTWNNSKKIDGTLYTNLQFYIKWDTNPAASGNNTPMSFEYFNSSGGLEAELMDDGWNNHSLGNVTIPSAATNGWAVMNYPYSPSLLSGISSLAGIAWHIYRSTDATNLNKTFAFWIDNIKLQGWAGPVAPPTMSFHTPTCKGLQLWAGASGGQYQRQMIRTVNTGFSWAQQSSFPMSYCWKICNFSPCVLDWFDMYNTGIHSWVNWYGLGTLSWDSGTDRWTNSASGSVKAVVPFTGASGEQFMYFMTFNNRWGWDWGKTYVANQFNTLEFDIKVDRSSAPGTGGDFSSPEIGFITSGTSTTPIGNYTIPAAAATNWVHASLSIPNTAAFDKQFAGIYMHDWVNGYLTNTLTFWIDNVILRSDFEQMHVFFVPDGSAYTNRPWGWGDNSIDWNCASMLFLRISQESLHNGTNLAIWNTNYICRIGFKTNEPSSETMIFNGDTNNPPVGLLCALTNATKVIGDWCLTFTSPTDFTINAPGGASASGTIPPDVAQNVFNDSMDLYFGHQPNSRANIFLDATSQTLTLNRIWVTNSAGSMIDDSFGGPPLDSGTWSVCAAVPAAIWIVPTNAQWILDWSTPATGFTLTTSANPADPDSWLDLPVQTANAIQPSANALTYITNGLPAVDRGFYAMVKRLGSRLQVLLPGESNAPGTASGKSGSPSPQTVGTPFDLTVNLCDATWHIVPSSDTVHFTSTDTNCWLPPDTALANGTVTIVGNTYFGTSGTWTITATDVSTPTITPGTSTAITIP